MAIHWSLMGQPATLMFMQAQCGHETNSRLQKISSSQTVPQAQEMSGLHAVEVAMNTLSTAVSHALGCTMLHNCNQQPNHPCPAMTVSMMRSEVSPIKDSPAAQRCFVVEQSDLAKGVTRSQNTL